MSLRNIIGIKKRFTEEDFKNKSLVQLLREGAEDAGYEVTINMCGKQVYPKTTNEKENKKQ